MNIAYKKIYNLFVEFREIEFYRYLYARNMTYLLYRFIDSEQLNDEERIQILKDLKWFFMLSNTLKVPTCQKSLSVLVDLIIKEKLEQALEICNIIFELRKYMDPEVRKQISKPTDEIYNEMMKNKIDNINEIKKIE